MARRGSNDMKILGIIILSIFIWAVISEPSDSYIDRKEVNKEEPGSFEENEEELKCFFDENNNPVFYK